MIDSFARKAVLVRIIDGDTVVVDIHLGFDVVLKAQICRLLKINAPEVRGASREKGLASKKFLSDYLRRKSLVVLCPEFDKGSFSRWLIVLYAEGQDGQSANVNRLLVEAGHALRAR